MNASNFLALNQVSSNTLSAAFSIAAILCWGSADFLGGFAARRSDTFLVTAVVQTSGLFIMPIALLQHSPFPESRAVVWALAAGLSGGFSVALFYRALAAGKMGLNAPVAAVVGATIPVVYGFTIEGMPHQLQLAGFVLAGVGIWLISRPDHRSGPPQGMLLAIVAGCGFAGFFLCIRQTGQSSALWVATLSRASGLLLMGSITLVRFLRRPIEHGRLGVAALAGICDVSGTVFFVRTSQTGRLDVSVVLCSLYPLVTVLLARVFLKERFTPLKVAGMAAAILAMPLITFK